MMINKSIFQNYLISNKKSIASATIFLIAFITRLLINFYGDYTYLGGNDAIGYHNSAIIIVNGHGDFGFFREPGYIYFIAAVYKLYIVLGHHIKPITDQFLIAGSNPEIEFLRAIQCVLSATTVMLFYKTIRYFVKEKIAITSALIASLYFPVAYLSAHILREAFMFFLFALLNYYMVNYYFNKKIIYLFLIGVLWGLISLTLQFNFIFFIPIIIFFLYFTSRNVKIILKRFTILFGLMLILVLPWLIRSYLYYPDLRTIRNMGCSFTFESMEYMNAIGKEYKIGVINLEETYKLCDRDIYQIGDSLRFQRSFDGTYAHKTKNIQILTSNISNNFYLKEFFTNFRISMMQTFFFNSREQQLNPLKFYLHKKRIPFVLLFLVFSYLSLPSFFLFFKKILPMLPIFLFFVLMFPIFGTESRRMLFIHPNLILFSVILINYLYLRIKGKVDLKSFRKIYLNNDTQPFQID